MSTLVETLARELEKPRELSSRVVNYIGGTYTLENEAIGSFLVEQLPKLEDYEVDLILSPLFTPKLADQAIVAQLLGAGSVPRDQWPALVQQLAVRPTVGHLVVPGGQTSAVPLREVTIERYVHRLRLDGTISQTLLKLIEQNPDIADQPTFKAVARRPVWEKPARADILIRCLAGGRCSVADTLELLDLVESYKPEDLPALLAWIPRRQEALREQINVASGGKPFFSTNIQELHGGGRDQRPHDDGRTSAKENELAFLYRLQQLLA